MRPLILRLFSAAKLLLMFELNKFLFLFLNDLLVFANGKMSVESSKLSVESRRKAERGIRRDVACNVSPHLTGEFVNY